MNRFEFKNIRLCVPGRIQDEIYRDARCIESGKAGLTGRLGKGNGTAYKKACLA